VPHTPAIVGHYDGGVDDRDGLRAAKRPPRRSARRRRAGPRLARKTSDGEAGRILRQYWVANVEYPEKLDALEPFFPDRMASRILGMGDIVTLVEKAQQQVKAEEAAKLQEKMAKGRFSLDDFMVQMEKMQNIGTMRQLLKMIPGLGSEVKNMEVDEDEMKRMKAIILSMTPKERNDPDLIDASRRRRIAEQPELFTLHFRIAFARLLDGQVSAIVGTHTHVQTADERILPRGTAYITDLGMTGPHDSVIGSVTDLALERFLKQMLGLRHLLGHRPQAVDILLYCMVIACLLLYLWIGHQRQGDDLHAQHVHAGSGQYAGTDGSSG
jgi:hypothetical protein